MSGTGVCLLGLGLAGLLAAMLISDHQEVDLGGFGSRWPWASLGAGALLAVLAGVGLTAGPVWAGLLGLLYLVLFLVAWRQARSG